jgi:hypothetical protein
MDRPCTPEQDEILLVPDTLYGNLYGGSAGEPF